MPSIADLIKGLNKLDAQSFRPGDSVVASTINHPVDAMSKLAQWLTRQTNTAAGIPSQYDNRNPLLAPSPDEQAQAGFDLAGMAQVGAFPFAPKGGTGTLGSITAYHGSPHKFDKFSMDKIGTGEGAQAYGHGLYFAESPKVAELYKQNLSKAGKYQPYEFNGSEYVKGNGQWVDIGTKKPVNDYILSTALSHAEQGTKPRDAIKNYKEIIEIIPKIEKKGSIYKTSLEWPDAAREAADPLGPQHFLDWDKPLSEQPQNVVDAINRVGREPGNYGLDKINDNMRMIEAKQMLNNPKGSQRLKEMGIPGIRYLDGGSRGAGKGSYNYVVFDDQIPKIVERNGSPLSNLLPATMLGYGMYSENKKLSLSDLLGNK